MRRLLALTATAAAFGLAACGGSTTTSPEPAKADACITTDTGQRICGQTAIDWCKATAASRELKIDLSRKLGDDTGALMARVRRCQELTQ